MTQNSIVSDETMENKSLVTDIRCSRDFSGGVREEGSQGYTNLFVTNLQNENFSDYLSYNAKIKHFE